MNNKRVYILLHLFLMLYTTGGVFSKLAAKERFLSPPFLLFYGAELLILAFYAVCWQQFLKRMPLSAAYANKAVTVVWGCVWGTLLFHERLTAGKVVGGLLALSGAALYGYADGQDRGKAAEP